MKFNSSEAIDHIIHMIEQGLEEHSKWMKLWNSRAICHLPFPQDYLEKTAHQECEFAKWFNSCFSEEWLHQTDYESIKSVHKTMHDEAKMLAEKIEQNESIAEEDYYRFVNSEWNFSQRLQRLKDKITRLHISFDPLTGIFNRQAMMPILLQEQAYIERDKKQCTLAMADLDYFKKINDNFGHANGDVVLKKIAGYLRSNLRPYDALFRYGGEEFLFCLPNTDLDTGRLLLDRIRSDLERMPIKLTDGNEIFITVSIGVTKMLSTVTAEEGIDMADQALYQAKAAGRNCIAIWESEA